jgi:hypothetical protein
MKTKQEEKETKEEKIVKYMRLQIKIAMKGT